MTDLSCFIDQTPLVDSHEHMRKEQPYVQQADILCDLFSNYVGADLVSAGAPVAAVNRLCDATDPDIAGRFDGVREAWLRCRYTGYGRAVSLIAREVYGIEELTAVTIEAAVDRCKALHQPGERLRLLRDVARLDHIQVDDFSWRCLPDESGPDFFLYDIGWAGFSSAVYDHKIAAQLHRETDLEVKKLSDLRQAMGLLFERYAPCAIAVKTQHAYNRTLAWQARSDADAEPIFQRLCAGEKVNDAEKLCFGDWCIARGVELAITHDLPIKIHTGYYAGYGYMVMDRIRPDHLCGLLIAYPQARFVLMHTGYPYTGELLALAKHFPNVYADLCWAWSIDPINTCDFVQRFIHTVPANKLFVFGGDCSYPAAAVAYTMQCRRLLTRALQSQIDSHEITEAEAIELASLWMGENQRACFDVDKARAAVHAAMNRVNALITAHAADPSPSGP